MVVLLASLLGCHAPQAQAATLKTGQVAPAFTLPDLDGNEVSLADYAGKTVVLEWFNPGCPFVISAHEGGPLETMAAERKDDVVWLAINSGAAGKQGHGADANKKASVQWKLDHPILLDESGEVGKAYNATNTPQMVVVDPKGTIAYWGAVDNAPRGEARGGKVIPYTANAIDAVLAGESPKPDSTKPWGCSVKY